MSETLKNNYDAAFYAGQKDHSLRSARIVLAKLRPVLGDVKSALDIGCGAGGWLKAFGEVYDCADVCGADHPGVPASEMFIPKENFSGLDLSGPMDLGRKFDVVMTLEVAEHIDPANADTFVDNLTRHGDRVLFSAATPRQGGTGHVNEQWPAYWAEKFAERGFLLYDIIRPLIWDEDNVACWYKQNLMFYARDGLMADLPTYEAWGGRAVVHPGMWAMKTEPLSSKLTRIISRRKPAHDWRDI